LCSFFLPPLCFYRQKQRRDVAWAAHNCPRRHVSSVSPTRGRPRVS
jgi:hypothetical protein